MKKIAIFVLVVIIGGFLFLSYDSTKKIEFDFSASEVTSVELYHFHLPVDAKVKVVTKQQDIQSIIETLATIKVQEKHGYKERAGSSTLSFRFRLSDGSSFEVIYNSYGVKDGEIKSSYAFDYITKADIASMWNRYDYEVLKAEEINIPVYDR